MLPDNLKGILSRWAATLVMVLAALAVIAVGELLPPLQAVQTVLAANPRLNQALIVLTAGMTTAGVFLLAFTQFLVKVPELPPGSKVCRTFVKRQPRLVDALLLRDQPARRFPG